MRETQWGISSAGRAPALQAGGRRFDPVILHQVLFGRVLSRVGVELVGQQQSGLQDADCFVVGRHRLINRLFFKNS